MDSATRREQLLDVADRIFTTHGVNAPLDLIVDAACVGRATLYRQFTDRHMLLLALMERSAHRLLVRARRLSHRDDAFFALLTYMGRRIAQSPALSDYWRTCNLSDPRFTNARTQVRLAFEPLIERAQQAGLLRTDVHVDEISLIACMLSAGLCGENESARHALVRRALEIVQWGLRPVATSSTVAATS